MHISIEHSQSILDQFKKVRGRMKSKLSNLGVALILGALIFSGLGAAPAHATDAYVYIVRPGDTMLTIAARYGVSVSQLAQANGIWWSSWVYVGQRLIIPSPQPAADLVYVVGRGDTLSRIARQFGTTVEAIMRANDLTSTRIYPSQRLAIPGSQPDTVTRYTVRWGDTLSKIARRFGTTVQAIMASNNLRSTTIYVGQRLVISGQDVQDPDPGWQSYTNADYAFAFRYPSTWTLEDEANLVKLSQGTLRLAIAFQRHGEDVPFPWTGMPAGDFASRGTMAFLDQEIERHSLVYEGKVKVLTYTAEVGDLMFSIRLDDMALVDYQAIEISEAIQSEVDQIVGSFEQTVSRQ